MMLNVQLFRMRPITAILVHWFKRYCFLGAPVSDRNTVHWRGIYLYLIAGGSRRNLGPLVLQRPKVACLPPPPTVDPCEFFLQLWMLFYRYEYFHKSLALPDSLFLAFFEVQNFQVFFGIPKSFRNWILTHPGSTKNQVSYIKNAHLSSTPKISTSVIFQMIFFGG